MNKNQHNNYSNDLLFPKATVQILNKLNILTFKTTRKPSNVLIWQPVTLFLTRLAELLNNSSIKCFSFSAYFYLDPLSLHPISDVFVKGFSFLCPLFAECSWWDGADTTLTILSRRSGRRPTTNQRQSWAPRRRTSGNSKRSDPSRQRPMMSPALCSATPSSGTTDRYFCSLLCLRDKVRAESSCQVITFVFSFQ